MGTGNKGSMQAQLSLDASCGMETAAQMPCQHASVRHNAMRVAGGAYGGSLCEALGRARAGPVAFYLSSFNVTYSVLCHVFELGGAVQLACV